MRFLLAPHAVTDWNIAGKVQGHIDTELCEFGRQQAAALTDSLMVENIRLIVTSDLKRSIQTGEIVQKVIDAPLQKDPRLCECAFGQLEGMTREEAVETCGEIIIPHWDDRGLLYDFTPWGGENKEQVLQRHLSALQEIKSDNPTLIIGHGRALDTLLIALGYKPGIERGSFRIIDIDA